jgi:uncharacterized protein (UPF0332 family)
LATWQDVGIDNFRAAVELYDGGHYRSATSRFYYATFSVLTNELIQRRADPDFRDARETPGHAQLPVLVETYFTQFSQEKLTNFVGYVRSLYRDRLAADYSLLRVDRQSGTKSYRAAEKVFHYLGVSHERK